MIRDSQSWVLMQWEPFQVKDYPFLSVLEHFRDHAIKVPNLVKMSPSEGLVLLEDLGDLTLERKFWENQNQETALPFYKKSMDELLKIHIRASEKPNDCTAFKIEFDKAKFLWEMNYGLDNLIKGICRWTLSSQVENEIKSIFGDVCERLDKEPKCIAHRDYHSRNLMIKLDDVRVIDFQDARLGPVQYDLVSLLRDSYVNMNDEMANQLLLYYREKSSEMGHKLASPDQFSEIYEIQTIQRCFKACGSFSSFYNQRGDTRYLKYLSSTLKRVTRSLTEFPRYRAFSQLLNDCGALERNYETP